MVLACLDTVGQECSWSYTRILSGSKAPGGPRFSSAAYLKAVSKRKLSTDFEQVRCFEDSERLGRAKPAVALANVRRELGPSLSVSQLSPWPFRTQLPEIQYPGYSLQTTPSIMGVSGRETSLCILTVYPYFGRFPNFPSLPSQQWTLLSQLGRPVD